MLLSSCSHAFTRSFVAHGCIYRPAAREVKPVGSAADGVEAVLGACADQCTEAGYNFFSLACPAPTQTACRCVVDQLATAAAGTTTLSDGQTCIDARSPCTATPTLTHEGVTYYLGGFWRDAVYRTAPVMPPSPPRPPLAPNSPAAPPLNSASHFVRPTDDLVAALAGASAGDVIVLADGTHTPAADSDTALVIGKDITIRAQTSGKAIIDGQKSRRLLRLTGGSIRLEGLQLIRGHVWKNTAFHGWGIAYNNYMGGGLLVEGGTSVTVDGCVIRGCEVHVAGQTMLALGGAVAVVGDTTQAEFIRTNLHDNWAYVSGGTYVFPRGGAVYLHSGAVSFTDCNLYANAAWGGASGGPWGGVMYAIGGSASFLRCDLYDNEATPAWGGGQAGGIQAENTNLTMIECTIRNNRARERAGVHSVGGRALVFRSNTFANNIAEANFCDLGIGGNGLQEIEIFNNTFEGKSGCASKVMVEIGVTVPFLCEPGTYMSKPPFTMAPSTFTGCKYRCPSGTFGNSTYLTDPSCSGDCPAGHYCPKGTADPLMCPSGTFLEPPPVVGTSASSCLPCTPGTYSPSPARSANGCIACPAGTLSEGLRATSCDLCPVGGYCAAVGAASVRQTFQPCAAGSYNPTTGASNESACLGCAVGKANPIPGSSSPSACVDCLPGGYASANGSAVCVLCEPGKFQGRRGQTACEACTW